MNIYKQNLESLRKRYPDIADAVEHLQDDYTVKVKKSKAGIPTMAVRQETKIWDIHSTDNPRQEAEYFVAGFTDFKSPRCLIIMGLGLGYYFDALMQKYGDTLQHIIVIESNLQVFKQFIANKVSAFEKDGIKTSVFEVPFVHFIVGTPPEQVFPKLFSYLCSNDLKTSYTSTYFIEHPTLIRFNKEYYKPIVQEFTRACLENVSLFGNDPEDSWCGIDHMIMNLDTIASNPGVSLAKDLFKGKPAVIVATGPSLNKNVHLLPELKNKAVFFSADASLKTLLHREEPILPDIVTCLERNLSTCNHFKQVDPSKQHLMKDLWLGACPVVKPEVYNAWPGKNMVVFRKFAQFEWIKMEKGILDTGKSVTNLAFSIACYMGCDPIILVGQDLAFAPDGKSHADGADHARDGLKASPLLQQRRKVMGNNGQMLDSLETWVGMLKRFQWDIANYDGVCINATEGGARIEGAQTMTLQDAIDTYCKEEFDVGGTLDATLLMPTADQKQKDLMMATEAIEEGLKYTEESLQHIDAIMEVINRSFREYNGTNVEEAMTMVRYIDKMKGKIFLHPMCYRVAMHVLQSWCIGHLNRLNALSIIYQDTSEHMAAVLIREYEFAYGLKILFQMIRNGIKESMHD